MNRDRDRLDRDRTSNSDLWYFCGAACICLIFVMVGIILVLAGLSYDRLLDVGTTTTVAGLAKRTPPPEVPVLKVTSFNQGLVAPLVQQKRSAESVESAAEKLAKLAIEKNVAEDEKMPELVEAKPLINKRSPVVAKRAPVAPKKA